MAQEALAIVMAAVRPQGKSGVPEVAPFSLVLSGWQTRYSCWGGRKRESAYLAVCSPFVTMWVFCPRSTMSQPVG